MPSRSRGPLLAIAVLSAVAGTRVAAQTPSEAMDEEITVFESQVTADLGELSYRERRRLRPGDLMVLEAGLLRQVTNLVPLTSADAWRVVVYIDAPLARSHTVRTAVLQLGEDAAFLTQLGAVEVLVADPEPRRVFGPSREDRLLARELSELAGLGIGSNRLQELRQAFAEADDELPPGDPRRREYLRREEALIRERADHLLLLAAEGCGGAPCLLFLVSDGFYEDPAAYYLGEARIQNPARPVSPALAASRELALTLPAYEWIVLPLPLRERELEPELTEAPGSDFERFIDHTGGVKMLPKPEEKAPDLSLEAVEVSVRPVLQPLQRMGVASAGRVVRVVSHVNRALERLRDLWRVYYLTERPLDGDPRLVEVRLRRNADRLESAAWVRSSTPAAVAGARLRRLLAGQELQGQDVAVEGEARRQQEGTALVSLRAHWEGDAELVSEAAVRVSVAVPRAEGQPWVGHQRVTVGELPDSGVWRHSLRVPLVEEADAVHVLVEGLVPRVWGKVRLPLQRASR